GALHTAATVAGACNASRWARPRAATSRPREGSAARACNRGGSAKGSTVPSAAGTTSAAPAGPQEQSAAQIPGSPQLTARNQEALGKEEGRSRQSRAASPGAEAVSAAAARHVHPA